MVISLNCIGLLRCLVAPNLLCLLLLLDFKAITRAPQWNNPSSLHSAPCPAASKSNVFSPVILSDSWVKSFSWAKWCVNARLDDSYAESIGGGGITVQYSHIPVLWICIYQRCVIIRTGLVVCLDRYVCAAGDDELEAWGLSLSHVLLCYYTLNTDSSLC